MKAHDTSPRNTRSDEPASLSPFALRILPALVFFEARGRLKRKGSTLTVSGVLIAPNHTHATRSVHVDINVPKRPHRSPYEAVQDSHRSHQNTSLCPQDIYTHITSHPITLQPLNPSPVTLIPRILPSSQLPSQPQKQRLSHDPQPPNPHLPYPPPPNPLIPNIHHKRLIHLPAQILQQSGIKYRPTPVEFVGVLDDTAGDGDAGVGARVDVGYDRAGEGGVGVKRLLLWLPAGRRART